MVAKTNVMSFLDSRGVKYTALEYSKEVFSVEDVARECKRPLDQIVKCLLLKDKNSNYAVACLPGNKRLDKQKARALLGLRSRTELAPEDELKSVVGCETGTLSPISTLAFGKSIPVALDSSVVAKEKVNISAGTLKAGLELTSKDLVALVNPRIGDVSQEESRNA